MHNDLLSAEYNDVVVLKLQSTEEILGRFISLRKTNSFEPLSVKIRAPQVIIPQMLGPQEMGIQLVPWIISDLDKDVNVDLSFVVTSFILNNDISKKYLEGTTSILI